MVWALPPHTAEEALARCIGPWRANKRALHADLARDGETVEARPVVGVVVADQEPWPLVEERDLAPLLGDLRVRRVARHARVGLSCPPSPAATSSRHSAPGITKNSGRMATVGRTGLGLAAGADDAAYSGVAAAVGRMRIWSSGFFSNAWIGTVASGAG